MKYIRHYNKVPRTVKWRYFDPTRRITPSQLLQSTSFSCGVSKESDATSLGFRITRSNSSHTQWK